MTGQATGGYDQEYFQDTYGLSGLKRFSMHWWSVRFYAGIAERWLRRIKGRRMLDIGCGHGFILAALERRYETYGIDVSEYAIQQCRRFAPGSHCATADVEQGLPDHLEPGTFDLVLARYLFEHLHDPRATMARLVDLLRPRGVLFYSVPNTRSLGARWKGHEWYAYKDPTHRSLLLPQQWLTLTREAGLVVRREFCDGYWDVPYVKWLPRWLQLPVFIGPSMLACLTARELLPPRFGENVIVIAQKAAAEGETP